VGLRQCSLSLVSTIEELLGRESSGFCLEIREYSHRDPSLCDHVAPSICNSWHYTDKRRSLGWYSSLADSGQEFLFYIFLNYLKEGAKFPIFGVGTFYLIYEFLFQVNNIDPGVMYLVKIVPRKDFFQKVVSSDQIKPLWFFVRHNLISRKNRVIPQLE
jgi:hypothetical protein